MSSKFMKIKRISIPFISLVILTSQLTGCATLNSKETLEEINHGSEVILEYNELDSEYIELKEEIDQITLQDDTTQQGLSEDELHKIFQAAYDSRADLEPDYDTLFDLPTKIIMETTKVDLLALSQDKTLPDDYVEQYKAWRPTDTPKPQSTPAHQSAPQQQQPVQQQKPVTQPQQSIPKKEPLPAANTSNVAPQGDIQWDPDFGATSEEAAAGKGGSLIASPEELGGMSQEGIQKLKEKYNMSGGK